MMRQHSRARGRFLPASIADIEKTRGEKTSFLSPLAASLAAMRSLHLALVAPVLIAAAVSAASQERVDPLRFFEGRTESQGLIKVLFQKPYRGRSIGQGRIERDGSLTLVQKVLDEGKPPHERRWSVRQVGPGKFAGTMSDATGPVTIEQVGERYRFRFTMDKMGVDEWLTPMPDGKSAKIKTQVRRFGLVVATSEATIRKL